MTIKQYRPLRDFLASLTRLVSEPHGQTEILAQGAELLGQLVANDVWLDDEFATPNPDHYQQYLLYADPLSRFSVVSFVWGPGQITPVHDHRVWGLIGMLRGEEISQSFEFSESGELHAAGEAIDMTTGRVE